MSRLKEQLREQFRQAQQQIVKLERLRRDTEQESREARLKLCMKIFGVLDTVADARDYAKTESESLTRAGRRLAKYLRVVERKLDDLLRAEDIVQIEFANSMARPEDCIVVETQTDGSLPDRTILTVVRPGYKDRSDGTVLRKAEVITVRNPPGH